MKIFQEEMEELILRRSQVERQTPNCWLRLHRLFLWFLLISFSVIVMLETVKKMMKHKETFFDFILFT